MSFSDIKQKDVINIQDGKRLGKPIDLTFNENACIEGIVVPDASGILSCFNKNKNGIEIPWARVRRIGDDVILVDIASDICK
ncbi:MAG: YlmC/YmxH family sporulation protein [Clostridia bacterium]|nr:YlmC/YmxH family sporulation protein [Clostridia bacterium]